MAHEDAVDVQLSGGELEAPVSLRGMFLLNGALGIPVEGYDSGEVPGVLILRDFVTIDGTMYIPVTRADMALAMFLTGKGSGGRSSAAFEHLKDVVHKAREAELRLKAEEAQADAGLVAQATQNGGEDLGLFKAPGDEALAPGDGDAEGVMSFTEYWRHLRVMRARLPATKVVNVEVGAHVPWPVKVLLQTPVARSTIVYMEASAQNVKGLKALVVHIGLREKKRRRSPLPYKPRGDPEGRQYFSRRARGYVQRTVSPSGRIRVLLVDPYILRTHRDCALLELSGDGEGSDS